MIERAFKGTTAAVEFGPLLDAYGDVVDLTGATISCKAVNLAAGSTEIAAALGEVIFPGTAGKARAEFNTTVTSALTLGAIYRYDGLATFGDGRKIMLGGGYFRVEEPVSVD